MTKQEKITITVALLLVLLALLAIFTFLIKKPASPQKTANLPQEHKQIVKLSLAALQKEYKVGDEIKVSVFIDSGGRIVDGLDVILRYNPAYLEVEGGEKFLDSSDSVFSVFPSSKIDPQKGKIVFSALATPPKGKFEGKGRVASISFKAKKKGETEISFVFAPSSTIDTNVSSFSESKDILEKVENLKLKIN
jgi:hypothetical protein